MVSFLKNNCKFYNHRILIKYFKICIFDNRFIINMWLYLIIYEKIYKNLNCTGNFSEQMKIY